MNSEFSRLRQKQAEELAHDTQSKVRPEQGQQFDSVEEILRYDSDQNLVPPDLADRVNQSIAEQPKPPASWWKRFFS
jgi:hypothetical protein